MKIFCIGRNYAAHIKELDNKKPDEPVIFSKPDTALLPKNRPLYFPKISREIHYELEIVLKINRVGKNIAENFAHKYYDEIGLGIDFTARDLQAEAKKKGLPWLIAKGFDGSAPISKFFLKENFDLSKLKFSLRVNGEQRQDGNTALMLFSFDYITSYLSKYFTLKKGDLIFTGTPKGVGPVKIGDVLEGYLEDDKILTCEIK